MEYSLAELGKLLGAELRGAGEIKITGVSTLEEATAGQVAFLDNAKYRKHLSGAKASAVILREADYAACPCSALILEEPYLGYAKAAQLFVAKPSLKPGIDPSARIGENCVIDPSAAIGPYCVIGNGVNIGADTIIEAGTVIGEQCQMGAACHLFPRVTLYSDVHLGARVVLHSGAVIGADGFGMANQGGKWLKIPQVGGVRIGDDVEIGANTTVDRGAIGHTVIEEGVKLDNQIQVGHNVRIGAHTAIAACSGISGSVTIGKYCRISGMVGFTGHFTVADGTVITGMTMVSKSIAKPGIYSSGTAIEPHEQWRKNAVRFRQLDSMAKKIQDLQKQMQKLMGEKETL